MKHLTHFERIAVVTDDKWMVGAIKAFGFMIPGEVRLFDNAELSEAVIWISQ
jgi:hypothetical protein